MRREPKALPSAGILRSTGSGSTIGGSSGGTVSSAEIENRKRFSDLISRPQVKLSEIINIVPRGTFNNGSVDFDSDLDPDLDTFIGAGESYAGLLNSLSCHEVNSVLAEDDRCASDSFMDAICILKNNTEYPVSALSSEFMEDSIKNNYKEEVLESVEISIKYRGYIDREKKIAEKIMRLENLMIPENFDFEKVQSLSIECRQKLKKYSPRTIAQASRISGVSPADISVLLVYFGR